VPSAEALRPSVLNRWPGNPPDVVDWSLAILIDLAPSPQNVSAIALRMITALAAPGST
jgi:hypothetical protein